MTVLARDAVAADHLVYSWPYPIGPECEVRCGDEEQVVMCPAWTVGDRLGPGHHLWRTPDPSRPVMAYFVLTAPVEVSFDLTTMFVIPNTGLPVRLRAMGSLQVRCSDPGLLIAQFVGLPFEIVNGGVLSSVTRSVERMLARLLTRRVVMSGSPLAATDPSMLGNIVEELVAYNPTAGAVFGIELIRMGYLAVGCDDGNAPEVQMPLHDVDWSGGVPRIGGQRARQRTHSDATLPPPGYGQEPYGAGVPITGQMAANSTYQPAMQAQPPMHTPHVPAMAPPEVPQMVAQVPSGPAVVAVAGEIQSRPIASDGRASGARETLPPPTFIPASPGPMGPGMMEPAIPQKPITQPGPAVAPPVTKQRNQALLETVRGHASPIIERVSGAKPPKPAAVIVDDQSPTIPTPPPTMPGGRRKTPVLGVHELPGAQAQGGPVGPGGQPLFAQSPAPVPPPASPAAVAAAAAHIPAAIPSIVRPTPTTKPPDAAVTVTSSGGAASGSVSGEIASKPKRQAGAMAVPQSTDVDTQPLKPSAIAAAQAAAAAIMPVEAQTAASVVAVPGGTSRIGIQPKSESRGSIVGIGMSQIGQGGVAGEIHQKVKPGARVLVPGPNGLMQSATVRQLLNGYYELEVGASGETIWVPIGGVVPEAP